MCNFPNTHVGAKNVSYVYQKVLPWNKEKEVRTKFLKRLRQILLDLKVLSKFFVVTRDHLTPF